MFLLDCGDAEKLADSITSGSFVEFGFDSPVNARNRLPMRGVKTPESSKTKRTTNPTATRITPFMFAPSQTLSRNVLKDLSNVKIGYG